MAKITLLLILLGLCLQSFAAPKQTLLTCLGKEEAMIHKNHIEGPLYNLNQQLINEVINLDEVPIKKVYLDQICNLKSDYSPSVNFLRILLLKGREMFDTDSLGNGSSYQMKTYAIESVCGHSPGLFFAYLSSLQALAKTPSCLDKKIPDMQKLMDRFRYLEVDLTVDELLKEKKAIEGIFKSLKDLDSIFKECEPKKKTPAVESNSKSGNITGDKS